MVKMVKMVKIVKMVKMAKIAITYIHFTFAFTTRLQLVKGHDTTVKHVVSRVTYHVSRVVFFVLLTGSSSPPHLAVINNLLVLGTDVQFS